MNVLFLCTGNIHRSPLAEAMLRILAERDLRSDIEVRSAGVACCPGLGVVAEARKLAERDGLDLSRHRSRFVTREDIDHADRILVMERAHREFIASQYPDALDRTSLLSDFGDENTGIRPGDDVPDATVNGVTSFRASFDIIRACVSRVYEGLPAAPQEVYAQAVQERFGRVRGTAMTMSPADWALVEEWWERGIPLWIVLEGIDGMFRRKGTTADRRRVRRLGLCRQEVEDRFREHERSSVGRRGRDPDRKAASPRETRDLLRQAIDRLTMAVGRARADSRPEAAGILEGAARELSSLACRPVGTTDSAAVRIQLHEVEDSLLAALTRLTDSGQLETLRENAASRLSGHKQRMTPEAFEATVTRLVAQGIRELHGLPSLAD